MTSTPHGQSRNGSAARGEPVQQLLHPLKGRGARTCSHTGNNVGLPRSRVDGLSP